MGIQKRKYNLDFFKKDSEELYYFLGFIASDGYVNDGCVSLTLNIKDEDMVKQLKDLTCPNAPLKYHSKTNSVGFSLYLSEIALKIKRYFRMDSNKKSFELNFPNIPQEYIKDFIRGYIDGDGCIDTTKGYKKNKIYIGPRLRILGNYDFLYELNLATKEFIDHKTDSITKKGRENVYYLTYNFSTADKLLNWLYKDANIYLKRKYDKAIALVGYRKTLDRTTLKEIA